MVKREYERLNAYLSPKVKEQLNAYAEEHRLSISSAVNLILEQFFDGKEAMSSMGNLSMLLDSILEKTGSTPTSLSPDLKS